MYRFVPPTWVMLNSWLNPCAKIRYRTVEASTPDGSVISAMTSVAPAMIEASSGSMMLIVGPAASTVKLRVSRRVTPRPLATLTENS